MEQVYSEMLYNSPMAYRWGLGDIDCTNLNALNPYDPANNFQLPEVCGPRDIPCIDRNSALDLTKQAQHQAYMDALAACGARSSGGPIVQAAFTPGAAADYNSFVPAPTPTPKLVTVNYPAASKPADPLSTMSAAVPPAKTDQGNGYSMSTQQDAQATVVSTGFDFSSIPWWGWAGAAAFGFWAMSGKH